MEFMDVVRMRRSVRKFKPTPIPKIDVEYVLEAARLAPSWGNKQCWRYIVVTDQAMRKRITMTDWAAGAEDDDAFKRVIDGYDHELLKDIRCPVLLIQGNPKKGGIFTDEAVAYAKANIMDNQHVYIPEYDHNLGLYSWDTGKLLQAINVFLESLR